MEASCHFHTLVELPIGNSFQYQTDKKKCLGPRAHLDVVMKTENSYLCWESNSSYPAPSAVAVLLTYHNDSCIVLDFTLNVALDLPPISVYASG